MKVECIDYRQLPGLNPILPKYLEHYVRIPKGTIYRRERGDRRVSG